MSEIREIRSLIDEVTERLAPVSDTPRLEADLHEQVEADADVKAGLQAAWTEARAKQRTGDEFAEWLDDAVDGRFGMALVDIVNG